MTSYIVNNCMQNRFKRTLWTRGGGDDNETSYDGPLSVNASDSVVVV